MSDKPLIWIVDDQEDFLRNLELALGIFFNVKSFSSSSQLMSAVDRNEPLPQLVVSDLLLENNRLLITLLDSVQFKTILKKSQILVLSGNPSQEVINRLLEKGVIDFISKPANVDELIVKIKRAISKTRTEDGRMAYHDDITTNPVKRLVYLRENESEELTGREFQVLTGILRSGNEGIGKKDLINNVWAGKAIDPSAFSVHLNSLRKKLKKLSISIDYVRENDTYIVNVEQALKIVS